LQEHLELVVCALRALDLAVRVIKGLRRRRITTKSSDEQQS
jgi:hypothetical protein